jgi:hypothetical protein
MRQAVAVLQQAVQQRLQASWRQRSSVRTPHLELLEQLATVPAAGGSRRTAGGCRTQCSNIQQWRQQQLTYTRPRVPHTAQQLARATAVVVAAALQPLLRLGAQRAAACRRRRSSSSRAMGAGQQRPARGQR